VEIATEQGGKRKEEIDRTITRLTIAENKKRKIRLLVAEDSISNQKVAIDTLEKMGYRVDAVANGQEAVEALKMVPYDLVLMDVQMPEMDGLEATKTIRMKDSNVLNPQIPIVALTAHVREEDQDRCFESGMNDYISKPVEPNRLFETINKWIIKGKIGEPVQDKQLPQTVNPDNAGNRTQPSIRILLAEDNAVNQKLAKILLTKAGYQVEVANNGLEAIQKYTSAPDNFQLILMDVQMPKLDGFQATKEIRRGRFGRIPIVAMTANAMKGDRQKCLDAGMDDYIPKPINKENVLEILNKWVLNADFS
jgi:CheY-like chemotaxis protein